MTAHRHLLFAATAVATTVYLVWRAVFTLPLDYGMVSIFFGFLLLICEVVAGFESTEQYLNMVNMVEPDLPIVPDDWYPDVDVLVITHNEDPDIIFKTANACKYLEYPDKSKVHIYICDDTNRPEMKALAEELGVGYFGLTGNKHAKAGTMNNAIEQTTSPLIATFDADMIPRSIFLMATVPYFFLPFMKKDETGRWVKREPSEIDPDEKIGFIQAPQSFYNPDLFQYNLYSESRFPNEQDYFFREINVGRNRSNSALFVGSNAVFSREALREVGGIAINTITEDFETGIRIQSKGYRTYALAKPLAHGMAPHTVPSLITQRDRWARGCIQSLHNVRPFFRKGLSLTAKISYFACAVYWWTFTRRFVYIVVPIVAVLFHVHVVECTLTQILIFWLPHYILTNQSLKTLSGNTRNQHWNNLIDTIMFPYLIIPVMLETVGIRKKKFVVTNKKNKTEAPARPALYALPHIFLLAASILSLVICVLHVIETSALYNVIIMFWLIINSKNLFFAICFMLGRTNFRKADRFYVNLPATIEFAGEKHFGATTDISETGLSVLLNFPVYLPDDQNIKVSLSYLQYQSEMSCQVVHVDPPKKHDDGWRFCLNITELDDQNRSAYSQIVFDRVHTLPQRINQNYTIYNDFRDNIGKRLVNDYERAARRFPRIPVPITAWTRDGWKVQIQDFNYKYAWLKTGGLTIRDSLDLECAPEVTMRLQRIPEAAKTRGGHLYQVLNLPELLDSPAFKTVLSDWVRQMQAGLPVTTTAPSPGPSEPIPV